MHLRLRLFLRGRDTLNWNFLQRIPLCESWNDKARERFGHKSYYYAYEKQSTERVDPPDFLACLG